MIHSTAIVSPSARIGKNVRIGPYSVIGDIVELEDDVEIMSHVCVSGHTRVGKGTRIFPFASIGYEPQDLKYKGEESQLIIGKRNTIREYVTVHPGTAEDSMKTVVGDDNLFMISVHIAHDCIIGNNIVMGNNATLGGHVKIGDNAIIGGMTAIHQRVRIGRLAVIGGMSGVEKDVIPYGAVKGDRAYLYDVNIVGLRRANVERKEILALKKAYETIFFGPKTLSENLTEAEQETSGASCVYHLLDFMKNGTNRSFCSPREQWK
ncbi:MAG: acyl-ACP--UDP-N-acetylglucosamine O-acyltransferase [Holosporaceae bacterium]|nr:acyl-ACP--UDP-N-acetylglucosamine O-acyltransferase [Holosporaceae bacterium]